MKSGRGKQYEKSTGTKRVLKLVLGYKLILAFSDSGFMVSIWFLLLYGLPNFHHLRFVFVEIEIPIVTSIKPFLAVVAKVPNSIEKLFPHIYIYTYI